MARLIAWDSNRLPYEYTFFPPSARPDCSRSRPVSYYVQPTFFPDVSRAENGSLPPRTEILKYVGSHQPNDEKALRQDQLPFPELAHSYMWNEYLECENCLINCN
jgi:hypothetical protein